MPGSENPIPGLLKEEFGILRLFRVELKKHPPEIWPGPPELDGERRRILLLNALDEEIQRRLEIGIAVDPVVLQQRYSGLVPDDIGIVIEYHQKHAGTETPRLPDVGTIHVPNYEILGPLDRGGMGIVYRALQVKAKRLVALKMILSGVMANDRERERFRAEGEAVAGLQHPNIVQVFDVDEAGGVPYFAMEFCDGGSLASRLRGTPLPPDDAAELIEQLADAMAYAHARGIIHRDLKPANILLAKSIARPAKSDTRCDTQNRSTRSGTGKSRGSEQKVPPEASGAEVVANFVPKVTDFGLAKQIGTDDHQTRTGAVIGTPSYMSPEQALGESKRVTGAADIYALGAILYECLTGRPPLKGATFAVTIDQVIRREPAPPTVLNSSVPRDLETICMKCLQKEPTKRYVSASELADDLRRFRERRPILARPAGPVERALKWARRRPTAATFLCSGFATVLLLLGLGAFAWIKWDAATAEQQRRALTQLDALEVATAPTVPNILSTLTQDRDTVLPHLRARYAEQTDPAKRVRLALALLPIDPEHLRDVIVDHLLGAEDPAEVLLARSALAENGLGKSLIERLWDVAGDANAAEPARFRALIGLAAFAPEDRRWAPAAPRLIEDLLGRNSNPLLLGTWVDALYPVRGALIGPLGDQFRDRKAESSGRHELAAQVLRKYVRDQPEALFELVLDADARQYELLGPLLDAHREKAIARMTSELEKQPDYWGGVPLDPARKPVPLALEQELASASGLTTEHWALCQNLPLDRLQAVTESLRESGYRPLTVRPWESVERPQARVALVWTRDSREWKLEADLSPEQLRQRDQAWQKNHFVLADIAGYQTTRGARFVGLWRRGEEDEQTAFCAGVTLDNHRQEMDKLKSAGYGLAHVQVMEGIGGPPLFSSTWVRGQIKRDWKFRIDEKEVYGGLVRDQASLMTDAHVIPSPGGEKASSFASIWCDATDREGAALPGLSAAEHRTRSGELRAAGFHPVSLSLHCFPDGKALATSVWHRPVDLQAREALARRQASAAVALLTLGKPESVWPLFAHSADPTRRSFLVWRAGQLGADPRLLVHRLREEKDISARRCLILALGEYGDKELPLHVREPLVEILLAWYRDDPDPGVHSAISWLLGNKAEGPTPRRLDWEQSEAIKRIDDALAARRSSRSAATEVGRVGTGSLLLTGVWTVTPDVEDLAGRSWYVNGQGQTMSVVRGPIEFRMGSPLWEPHRTSAEETAPAENRQLRRIDRNYAIATTSVTVDQWQKFLKDNPSVPTNFLTRYSPDPTGPILNVSWIAAARYCNWLSAKEGIPPDQWCYPTEIDEGVSPVPGYLHRTGYRLPTEAEWEFACRTGAESARYFGSADELLPRYAHLATNSRERAWPVGQKRPNDLGLFDVHGNIFNWCDDRERVGGPRRPESDNEDLTAFSDKHRRAMRGGYFNVRAPLLRSAFAYYDRPTNRDGAYGLRVCRTICSVSRP